MLTILSTMKASSYCDGVSRRSFLQLGSLGIGGLTLADLLRAEAGAAVGSSNKAVINIHLSGGPSHQDMFDMKPDAPVEFRGQFNPIATNVPGIEICELMPRLAKIADKYTVVRSLFGTYGSHTNFQTHTGFGPKDLLNVGGRPALGAVVGRLQGANNSGAPPWISYNGGSPGYLGAVYKQYQPRGGNLRLVGGMTAARLKSRTDLLVSMDRIRRDIDSSGQMEALDSFTQQAVGVVTSGRVADALDLDKEDPKIKQRYGGSGTHMLRARRLVEAGVRVVTFNWGSWDTHGKNFRHLRGQLPKLDVALSALVEDLHERGLDKDVTIVAWGEFGRTPRINKNAGRDHWDDVSLCFLAGGGMRTGQYIGSSDRIAAYIKNRPVHFQEVFATLYHNLGINPQTTQLIDPAGRPQYLVNHHTPITELL